MLFSKSLIVPKILFKKSLKFNLCHWGLGLRAMFILILTLYYFLAKKQGVERDIVASYSIGNFKMIFTLLAKTIVIKVQLFMVKIRDPSLKGSLLKFWLALSRRLSLSLSISFYKLFKQFIGGGWSRYQSGNFGRSFFSKLIFAGR